ncbi:hypothetical protein SARC_05831 [Sphaeroforma arctica JP610]|uniref:Large ribosomal subunit protein mL44 n=1 Tax=Sphaeroforma arctica JP610 TaxID=667725 RepID=A0A0L0FZ75_9EUKA|nr:hypothetical protein SARC_05831 [Sphaeroforma arctica JP610]KNC81871.1 hypothetical protein SARC_05831 [Sphaeroforma arctica JP610]|eukprot:XP_014155773.1 hypothetical protein SARC_05831 [Sphaeroforma arctica JP610]
MFLSRGSVGLRRLVATVQLSHIRVPTTVLSRSYVTDPYAFAIPAEKVAADAQKAQGAEAQEDTTEKSRKSRERVTKKAQIWAKRAKADLAAVRHRLGGQLSNSLVQQAVTFPQKDLVEPDNSHLVLLGSCVYGLYVMEHITTIFPNARTTIQKDICDYALHSATLAACGNAYGLASVLQYEKTEETDKDILAADVRTYTAEAMKAIAGALYARAGPETARQFVRETVLFTLSKVDLRDTLQIEKPMQMLSKLPFRNIEYRILNEAGRVTYQPTFYVGVFSDGENLAKGAGHSLTEAKAEAARMAIVNYIFETSNKKVTFPSDKSFDPLSMECLTEADV